MLLSVVVVVVVVVVATGVEVGGKGAGEAGERGIKAVASTGPSAYKGVLLWLMASSLFFW